MFFVYEVGAMINWECCASSAENESERGYAEPPAPKYDVHTASTTEYLLHAHPSPVDSSFSARDQSFVAVACREPTFGPHLGT